MVRLISSATRTTCAISATACTRTMCAPASTAAVTAAAVPQSRSGAGRPPTASRRNDLRDGPTSDRTVERRGELRQTRPAHHNCATAVWQTRRRGRRSSAPARRPPAAAVAARPATPPVTSATTSSYCGLGVHRLRRAARCASGSSAAPVSATAARQLGIAPQAADVVDNRRAGGDGGARDAGLVGVDGDRDADAGPAARRSTGSTRDSSSSAETGSAPGRVDSPPMSIRSAPSASMRSAAATASRRIAKRDGHRQRSQG